MPLRNQLPASLRYFKARLRPLTRPPVWGTAIILSVVGLVACEYWLNPELLTSRQKNGVADSNNSASPSLSREDSRIGADIDSLPVLLNDLNKSSVPVTPITLNKKTQASKTKGLYDDLLEKQQAATANTQSTPPTVTPTTAAPAPNIENPLLVQAQNQLRAGPLNSGGTSLGVNPYLAPPSQPAAGQLNQSATAQSARTEAIANPAARPTAAQSPISGLGQPLSTNTLPSQNLPLNSGLQTGTSYTPPYSATNTTPVPNPYTYPGGSQPVSGVAPATPAVPVAPVASPVAPPGASNITPYSLQVPSQDSETVTNPVFRSSLGNQDSQRTGLQQSNLSNNRPFPGSSLNGGLGAER